jgi:hypothetical protein
VLEERLSGLQSDKDTEFTSRLFSPGPEKALMLSESVKER